MFFESLAECSFGLFTYVCVTAVDVTRDVIHDSTLVFGRRIRVYYHRAEGVHQLVVYVYVM
jgi:hypothetical protein